MCASVKMWMVGIGLSVLSVAGAASGSSLSVTDGLTLRLDAKTNVVKDADGYVTSWGDQSGQGHNASALVGHVTADGSSLVFDGTSSLALSGQVLSSQSYSIFAVAATNDASTQAIISNWAWTNFVGSAFLEVRSNAGGQYMQATDYYSAYLKESIVSNRSVLGITRSSSDASSSMTGYQDGDSLGTIDTTSGGDRNLATPFVIGTQGGLYLGSVNAEYLNGTLSALLVYDRALSTNEIASVNSYLSSTFVTAPEPSTVALAVSGIVALLAYAWRARSTRK